MPLQFRDFITCPSPLSKNRIVFFFIIFNFFIRSCRFCRAFISRHVCLCAILNLPFLRVPKAGGGIYDWSSTVRSTRGLLPSRFPPFYLESRSRTRINMIVFKPKLLVFFKRPKTPGYFIFLLIEVMQLCTAIFSLEKFFGTLGSFRKTTFFISSHLLVDNFLLLTSHFRFGLQTKKRWVGGSASRRRTL
jgi:hypothetical protein